MTTEREPAGTNVAGPEDPYGNDGGARSTKRFVDGLARGGIVVDRTPEILLHGARHSQDVKCLALGQARRGRRRTRPPA
jgi:hypothetical protein